MENNKKEIPLKGIYIADLIFKNDQNLPSSGHPVSKVSFTDFNGLEKFGFFKPLDTTYPELLALISVTASVYLKLALGTRAAEERLVFNDKNEIIGTLSINLDKFKPLATFFEKEPSNKSDREAANPSVHTLLQSFMALLLVAMWKTKNDDLHPGNISLFGVIDFDMIWYHLTHIIKGKRWSSGYLTELPKKGLELKWKDIDNFPCIDERTHWPTYETPNNLYKPKSNKSFKSFSELAANPVLETEVNVRISFEQQKFEAILQHLLAYDPDMLRARLKDYIGDIPLDYLNEKKLPKEKAEQLSQFNKELFNTTTNSESFINMILNFIQKEYDEFYCTTVTYPGCEKNIKDVSVPPFHHFLRTNPQAYHNIKNRLEEENETIKISHKNYAENLNAILFNTETIEKRYLQVLRDSHLFVYNSILNQFEDLISNIALELNISQHLSIKKNSFVQLDSTLTESTQLIRKKNIELESSKITIDIKDPASIALEELIGYVNQLYDTCIQYIELPRKQLTIEDNELFCKKILQLHYGEQAQSIQNNLETTNYREHFFKLQRKLESLTIQFKIYDIIIDEPQNLSPLKNKINLVLPNHTHEKVIETCVTTLFEWAKSIELGALTSIILDVINNHYTAFSFNLFANREREEPVTSYLKTAETYKIRGDIVLAAILSEGGREPTSLNTQIVYHLITLMLKDLGSSQLNVNLSSIQKAMHDKKFNLTYYTNYICDAAQKRIAPSKIKNHSNMTQGLELFKPLSLKLNGNNNNHEPQSEISLKPKNKINKLEVFNTLMYKWVNSIPKKQFYKLVHLGLDAYDKPKSTSFFSFATVTQTFSNKSRRPTVEKLLKILLTTNESNSRTLALIFSEGKLKDTSLNTKLFDVMYEAMIEFGAENQKFQKHPGFNTFLEMKTNKQLRANCLQSLCLYAKPWTFKQELPQKQSTTSMSLIPSDN